MHHSVTCLSLFNKSIITHFVYSSSTCLCFIVCSLFLNQTRKAQAAVDSRPISSSQLFVDRWKMNNLVALRIEQDLYLKLIAPPGIAPQTKRPLTVPSHLSSHHWLSFTKVYGKYLLTHAYEEGPSLQILCNIIDLVQQCVASTVTPESLARLNQRIQDVAKSFEKSFPASEWSIVMHLLVFHIPDTIKFWGPARSYWCFPFER